MRKRVHSPLHFLDIQNLEPRFLIPITPLDCQMELLIDGQLKESQVGQKHTQLIFGSEDNLIQLNVVPDD